MVSKGEMWVFDSSCITQPQSQISTDEAVMSYAVSRYLTLWLRDAARVKYPHFTLAHHRVSSSSVVRASVLEHGGSWVRIPSGARIFSKFPVGSFVTPCI